MRAFNRIIAVTAVSLLGFASAFLAPSPARAEQAPCPDARRRASPAAQAFCWFENHRLGSGKCGEGEEGAERCIANAADWCDDAALDEAKVADACFLSYLRAGRFEQAQATAAYLQTPAEEAERCREALTVVSLRVVSNPPGARIEAGGREYGEAPVEVKLTGQWWTKQVTAVFDADGGEERIEVTREQLIAAFDPQACVMGDLVVTGPEPGPAPVAGGGGEDSGGGGEDSGGGGRLWTWVALGGAAAFGATAVVFRLVGDAQYDELTGACPQGCTGAQIEDEIDASGVETSDLLTNLSLGLSGALLATAVVLFFVEGDGESEPEGASAALGIGPGGLRLKGTY